MPESTVEKKQATSEEIFQVLYNSLLKFHTGFVASAFQVTGFLLLIMGWILTSDTAQNTLENSVYLRSLAVTGLAMASVLYGVISFRVRWLSDQVYGELEQLAYMPSKCYSDRKIMPVTLFLFVSSNVLLTIVACLLIWLLPETLAQQH